VTRLVLGLCLLVLFLFAYLTGIRPGYALAYALGLLFLLALAWPALAARRIQLVRTLSAGTPTVGETFEESFTVTKGGWIPAPWVEVRDLSRIRGYQPGRVVSVGREPVSWRARGTYPQRGWLSFGPTLIRVCEPFGIFSRERRVGERHQVLVYPQIRPLPDLLTPAAQHAGDSPRFGAWADYPPETAGVRDYAHGDAFGRIHWPLSIKHGSLVSKTFEQPLTADLWIVLDLDRKVHFGEGQDGTVEYAVSLAASIAMQIMGRGRTVGLIANDARATLLEPHRAVRQDRVLLDYLAVAEADGASSLATALSWDRVRRLPRRAVAVITPSRDPGWVRSLQAVRSRSTALLAFYIDAASFGAAEASLSFDLGSDVDLYIIRRGEDFSRLVRTRDAVRLV
jgi:uncharacterized protein (DUF58 family)